MSHCPAFCETKFSSFTMMSFIAWIAETPRIGLSSVPPTIAKSMLYFFLFRGLRKVNLHFPKGLVLLLLYITKVIFVSVKSWSLHNYIYNVSGKC